MTITNKTIYNKASEILSKSYGVNAIFRDGQYEAIESVFVHKRSLIVQKTGWGKSLVYFVSTKLNRENGAGITLVICPLLSLMQNQVEAAAKFGLKCCVLNSTTKDDREMVISEIVANGYDLAFITPETLFSDTVQSRLPEIRIGLFVVDEAHCISDWGHDFRLEFGQISRIVRELPVNTPILATTATANDRVVADLKKQLGDDVYISRGGLHRESLAIQVLKMKDKAERYAWILKNINRLPGSGIIYCLTTRDCDYLTEFLVNNGINAAAYHSALDKEDKNVCIQIERKFMRNEYKVLVATIKLGMGYDKGDIGFVIHFQRSANIVSYYQQIGRAGRNLDYAYIILMSGREDEEIHEFFINTAFPTLEEAEAVVKIVEEKESEHSEIMSKANFSKGRVDKALAFLESEKIIFKDKKKYSRSVNKFVYNKEHYDAVTAIRRKEQDEMRKLIETNVCYSRYIINCLDDQEQVSCGRCRNCLGRDIINTGLTLQEKEHAARTINAKTLPIMPRKKWASTSLTKQTTIAYQNEEGVCIAKYGDVGFGELIKDCKTNKVEYPKELIERAKEILLPIIKERKIKNITFVPSLRSRTLENYAKEVAKACGVKCLPLLKKLKNTQQKTMQNSSFQCSNALTSYAVDGRVPQEDIILMDDMVDSKWTITVCGFMLREQGCTAVIPFALADSGQKEAD